MWVPKTTDELENAVGSGDLAETPTLDFKEKLPPKSKNLDLAIDIDAMTPDGGVLIYGVAEDEHGRHGSAAIQARRRERTRRSDQPIIDL
jgi:hypothetical protein